MLTMGTVDSLTEIRHANWFSQGHIGNLQTTSLPVGSLRISNINFRAIISGLNESRIVMPNSGFFVGLIIHVGTNNTSSGTTEYQVRARRFSGDYATEVTLGTVVIPTGETGCFYSDFLSEGTRKYFQYDGLSIIATKPSGSTSAGCSDVEGMLGLEAKSDFGGTAETYTELINF